MAMPMGEVMSMKPVSSIPVPAFGTTKLAPGGYHVMLDLWRSIRSGETIPLRLHFARAGWIATSTHVR
jgi:copper(I)-binding protein